MEKKKRLEPYYRILVILTLITFTVFLIFIMNYEKFSITGRIVANTEAIDSTNDIGKYSSLLSAIEQEKTDIWKILEKILRAGLPPRAGRGRWKFLYK